MEDLQKFMKLKTDITDISNRKIRLEERFNNEKDRLEKLVAQITAKGYDPKKLSEIRKQKEEELKILIEDLQIKTKEIKDQLNLIEGV